MQIALNNPLIPSAGVPPANWLFFTMAPGGTVGYSCTLQQLQQAVGAGLYDIAGNYPAAPINGIFWGFVTLRGYTLGANCAGSYAIFSTGPSTQLVISILKNEVSFGTITFPAATPSVGVFSCPATTFVADDRLELQCGAANFGATNLMCTFAGTRT